METAEHIKIPAFLIAILMFLVAYPYFHQHYPHQIAIVGLFFSLV